MCKRLLLVFMLLFVGSFSAAKAASTADSLPTTLSYNDTLTYMISFHSPDTFTSATFLLTYNPFLRYENAQGVSLITSTNLPDVPLGFSNYGPGPWAPNFQVQIGGLNNGGVWSFGSGSDPDFALSISTNPLGYLVVGNYAGSYFDMEAGRVLQHAAEVTVADVAATPEPPSLLLLGTGVLGAAAAARRRFAV